VELKPGYKQTKVGVIPKDWSVKQLGEIGESLIGLTYKPSNVKSDGLLVLRASNVSEGALRFEDNVFVDIDVPARIIVSKGDILICVRNGSRDLIGKCAQIDKRAEGMTFGAFMAVFRTPFHGFVYHQFQSDLIKRQIHEHLGATINQITNKSLNSFRIPFPEDEAERRTIAGALSDVDTLISALDQLIAKKRDLKQAAMQKLLTRRHRLPGFHAEWEVKRLGEIGSTYGGLTGKIKADFGQGRAQYITFLNVMNNVVIDPSAFESVRVDASENQNEALKGDLFFNGSSETPGEVGMCSVLQQEVHRVYLNSFCFGFRLRDAADADGLYLAYYFRSSEGRKLLYSLAQGATRYNLSKMRLLELEFSLPKKEEQTAIATVLSNMDAELSALEARRDKTRALRQGMMQELLTGKTRLV
jgi:type I restriction enzyme S subunit